MYRVGVGALPRKFQTELDGIKRNQTELDGIKRMRQKRCSCGKIDNFDCFCPVGVYLGVPQVRPNYLFFWECSVLHAGSVVKCAPGIS